MLITEYKVIFCSAVTVRGPKHAHQSVPYVSGHVVLAAAIEQLCG